MTICQLALQIRGDEGEFDFLRLHGSSHPGHVKCHEVYSDGPDLCDTMLKRELALSNVSKEIRSHVSFFRAKYNLSGL